MRYNHFGKNINIPDADIKKSMATYGITQAEAIQMWLEDEGYEDNDEVEELTEKAKKNKAVQHEAKATEKKPRKAPERKADEEKEHLIDCFRVFLEGFGADNVEITNKSKIVEFDLNDSHYKVDLIRQRKAKKST